jgi:C1A family cysteine protease
MTTSEYPYTARDGSCKYNSADTTGKGATGYVTVAANDSDAMKIALAGRPLAVSIEADQTLFQNYESGIFDSELCGTTLDHAVIVVGWGVTDSVEYWTIRNSWGATWGEKGYIRMAITDGSGICGVQIQPLYPTV